MQATGTSSRNGHDSQSDSSRSDVDIREDSEGWEDLEPDVETVEVKDFFSDATFPSAAKMLEYCKATHGFDLVKTQRNLGSCVFPLLQAQGGHADCGP